MIHYRRIFIFFLGDQRKEASDYLFPKPDFKANGLKFTH